MKRRKAKVQWTFAPLNGFAGDGEFWAGKRSRIAKRRQGAAERRGRTAANTKRASPFAPITGLFIMPIQGLASEPMSVLVEYPG